MSKIYLAGYTSEADAFVVDDYPYGFRLRCKIRYWLEHDKRGTRFCSQTTNPKVPGEVWNRPKKSTYCSLGGAMFLDDRGHVDWEGVTDYSSLDELIAFREAAGLTLPSDALSHLNRVIEAKTIYEAEKARGEFTTAHCATVAALVGLRAKDGSEITIERAREMVRERVAAETKK
jgi:hypothetical protein